MKDFNNDEKEVVRLLVHGLNLATTELIIKEEFGTITKEFSAMWSTVMIMVAAAVNEEITEI